MIIYDLSKYTRGWFVGDFSPSIFNTKDFEVGILTHKKDEIWPKHFHKIAKEINVLLEGKMIIQDKEILPGQIFVLEPWEIANPIFLEDCKVLVIKTPSIKGDKYEVVC
jgi:quercetin dioxygenase-like cupin family protein